MGSPTTRFLRFFGIHAGEAARVGLMAALLFCLLGANSVIKIVRDALFLSRFPITQLPYVYLLAALLASIVMGLYTRYTARLSLAPVMLRSQVFVIFSAVVFWLLITFYDFGWILYALYMWSAIVGLVVVAQFWTLANDMFNPREAKRLFGVLTAAGTVGAMAGGFGANLAVNFFFGTKQLLWLAAILFAGAVGVAWFAVEKGQKSFVATPRKEAHGEKNQAGNASGIIGTFCASGYLQAIAALIFVSVVVSTLIDYQFKAAAKQAHASANATVDYIRSSDGPLKTLTLTAALVPVYQPVNAKFGKRGRTNFASKLYLLLYDTDLDFMVLTGQSRTTRYGFDFSKNLTTNWEIHGEFGVINNLKTTAIDAQGQNFTRKTDAVSYLLGMRYLAEQDTTYILEYYRNAEGFTRQEIKDFISFVDKSYDTFVAAGNDGGLARAKKLLAGPYGKPNPGRHYLYFRASQKEPFDILYLTPALTAIMNVADASLTVIPEIAYSPFANLELRFRTAVLLGKRGTDYGEKQNDYRVEFRIRYHFGL